jgi:hypothetical protein
LLAVVVCGCDGRGASGDKNAGLEYRSDAAQVAGVVGWLLFVRNGRTRLAPSCGEWLPLEAFRVHDWM